MSFDSEPGRPKEEPAGQDPDAEKASDDENEGGCACSGDAGELVKIVNALLLGAISQKATAIHIEPCAGPAEKDSKVILRYRVDGRLVPAPFTIPWVYRNAVLARLKIMSNSMDIAERRFPQHGRIALLAKGERVDFHVETAPTPAGESCVMRVLRHQEATLSIQDLGLLPDTQEKLLGLLKDTGGRRNTGVVLVCGTAGSGRHTTLYSILNQLARPELKIVTAECPVRRKLDGVVQLEVNPGAGMEGSGRFDFATALRSILRQDPDVIMIEELGDFQTAELIVKAAVAGHLVFTTVHTPDAPSALRRLVEMGLPPYMLAAGLRAALAQRLVRRLCPHCRAPRPPTAAEAAAFKTYQVPLPEGTKLHEPSHSSGCASCHGLGFAGLVGLQELLIVSEQLRGGLAVATAWAPMRELAARDVPRTLVQDGLEKAKLGWTTVSEVLGD